MKIYAFSRLNYRKIVKNVKNSCNYKIQRGASEKTHHAASRGIWRLAIKKIRGFSTAQRAKTAGFFHKNQLARSMVCFAAGAPLNFEGYDYFLRDFHISSEILSISFSASMRIIFIPVSPAVFSYSEITFSYWAAIFFCFSIVS